MHNPPIPALPAGLYYQGIQSLATLELAAKGRARTDKRRRSKGGLMFPFGNGVKQPSRPARNPSGSKDWRPVVRTQQPLPWLGQRSPVSSEGQGGACQIQTNWSTNPP